jgi:hypothetical protein
LQNHWEFGILFDASVEQQNLLTSRGEKGKRTRSKNCSSILLPVSKCLDNRKTLVDLASSEARSSMADGRHPAAGSGPAPKQNWQARKQGRATGQGLEELQLATDQAKNRYASSILVRKITNKETSNHGAGCCDSDPWLP